MATRTERFFTWVWRINGLLLLVLIAVCLIMFWFLLSDASNPSWMDDEQSVREVAGTDISAENLKLQSFNQVYGTPWLMADLVSTEGGLGVGSSSRPNWQLRNVLFIDSGSKQAHWLFETSDREIRRHWYISDSPGNRYGAGPSDDSVVIGMLFSIAASSAQNGGTERRQLLLVSADGKTKLPLSEPIDELLGQHHSDASSFLIFYVRDGAVNVLDLDPEGMTVRSDSVITAAR